jgi:hypothetical protein
MRQAKEASANVPNNNTSELVGGAGLAGAGAAGAVAHALGPGQYRFRTERPDAASVFVKELRALDDQDTRLETSGDTRGQSNAYFKQADRSGRWDTVLTVSFLKTPEGFLNVTLSGQSMTSTVSSLADIGGAAAEVAGALLNPVSAITKAGRVIENIGEAARKAADLGLSGKAKAIVERVGAALEKEQQEADRVKTALADEKASYAKCVFCGVSHRPLSELEAEQWGVCLNCGAPRKLDPEEQAQAEAELRRRPAES